jgi:Adenylate and Guanylate cyclase catalytic domain
VADALPESSAIPALGIAHVLFMDIVAYSKLPMDRQQGVLHDLQEAVRSTPTFIRAAAEDQLIRLPTGDGMALVFFEDPEAPVRCALELAKALRSDPDIELRIGIHTGPVYRVADINMNRNVAGGGVNIAQRVMDCGDAGHILVSSAAAEIQRSRKRENAKESFGPELQESVGSVLMTESPPSPPHLLGNIEKGKGRKEYYWYQYIFPGRLPSNEETTGREDRERNSRVGV